MVRWKKYINGEVEIHTCGVLGSFWGVAGAAVVFSLGSFWGVAADAAPADAAPADAALAAFFSAALVSAGEVPTLVLSFFSSSLNNSNCDFFLPPRLRFLFCLGGVLPLPLLSKNKK